MNPLLLFLVLFLRLIIDRRLVFIVFVMILLNLLILFLLLNGMLVHVIIAGNHLYRKPSDFIDVDFHPAVRQ